MKQEQLEKILDLVDDPNEQGQQECSKDNTLEKDFEVMKMLAIHDLKEGGKEKQKILNERFRKFYLYNLKKNKVTQYFDEKPQIDRDKPEELAIVHQKLLVYGTDFMNKAKIIEYFKLKDESIKFTNSSTCEIQIPSEERMKEILIKVLIKQSDFDDLINLQWMQLKPYYEQGIERRMQARLGTNKDVYKNINNINKYIEKETKKTFVKQKLANNQKLVHHFRKEREDSRIQQIYQKRQLPKERSIHNNSNQSFNLNNLNLNEVINISSESECEDNVSQTVNNMQFSMQLDISGIPSEKQYPDIYDEVGKNPQFKRFKLFSYKDYDREQEENAKKKETKLIVLEE